jgi:hypothetical protein
MELSFLVVLQEKPPSWWDVAWSTWALVGVGIVAAYLALRTLSDIQKQTKNTKIAADAALLNAQAVINAERAWVIVDLDWIPACPKITHGSSSERGYAIRQYTSTGVRFRYMNEGKTIAWIDQKLACCYFTLVTCCQLLLSR